MARGQADDHVGWLGHPRLRRGEGAAFNEALGELQHTRDAKIARYCGPASFTVLVFGGMAGLRALQAGHWMIPALWLLILFAFVWTGASARARLTIRALQIARHRNTHCFECQYDLRGVPSKPDGLTTCPECGAAWRLVSHSDARVDNGRV